MESVQPKTQAGYKMLLLDNAAKRIVEYTMNTSDLLNRKCANVLMIDEKRTSDFMDALYIVEPTSYSVSCIAADFTRNPPRYSQAHVFFLEDPSNSIVMELKNSAAGRYLATLKTADFGVLALESRAFSLGDSFACDMLYNRTMPVYDRFMDIIASKIVNVCGGSADSVIRYWNPTSVRYPKCELPQLLANCIQKKLENAPPSDIRTQFLILDRNVDVMAPLMHEFTLQAMAYDFLDFKDMWYTEDDIKGRLDDKDKEWTNLRHSHIALVMEKLDELVKEIREQKANYGTSDGAKKLAVRDISKMVADLPDYFKSRDSVQINLLVGLKCREIIENEGLIQIGNLEQTFALGTDDNGRQVAADHVDVLVRILANPKSSKKLKQRLIMIYLLSRETGLYANDFERLQHLAGLEPYELAMIQSLRCLGVPVTKQSNSGKENTPLPQFYGENTSDQQLMCARFVPGVQNIIQRLVDGQLSTELFPTVGDKVSADGAVNTVPSSLRKQRATWSSTQNVKRPRLVVFMLGGFTASERRAVYEVSASSQWDIIIGGNDETTAETFLKFLARQQLPRERLGLPCDQPRKKAPAFLFESDSARKRDKPAQPQPQTPSSQSSTSQGSKPLQSAEQFSSNGLVKEKKEKKGLFNKLKKR